MARLAALAVCLLLFTPAASQAWGVEAHQLIMDRAIGLLPPEIRPLFEKYRATVVERAIDPDTWRTAGFDQEDPHHFLDIDWPGYGPYPFAGLPRDYDAAVAKFGVARVRENGLVPWRSAEMYGNLRRAFEAYRTRGPFGRSDILFYSAWLAHYVSDAHQPLHGVVNYNGQTTNQFGVHARFESTLFERYRDRLRIAAETLAPITNPRDAIFDAIIESTRWSQPLLKADRDAIGPRDVYDDQYYEAFFAATQTLMELRINQSITVVAAMISGAWEAAGKPAVAVDPPAPPQRRRR